MDDVDVDDDESSSRSAVLILFSVLPTSVVSRLWHHNSCVVCPSSLWFIWCGNLRTEPNTDPANPVPTPFGGGGYRLGAAPEEESAYVSGERRQPSSSQNVNVVLKLWKTGFSLDDGELRNYSDPGNALFLEAIRRGEIPLELRQRSRGGQVNLDMEDHRDEDFSKPKSAFRAFTGEGQKLGSATPELVSLQRSPQDQAASEAQATASISLDSSQPVTSIQIRLADGGRLVQKFNHTHRILDVRQFVASARPALAAAEFVLMTTFPNKELMDESQTLKDANLLNAVIVQQLK
ncbi:NSFL1 cofactor p47 [Xyrauchen texanus]|uniref:NSFL1 cofactor p47 n=1 Tax=Xyrauchen texanus TaxID=154827 RepID=UPI0022422D5A|nr:NSFL1 cofactor p47 [Xyrauchen texanus]